MDDLRRVAFAKGHGTGNDFVILPDPDGVLPMSPQLARLLCDRRRGIGGDGVLRVVRAGRHPETAGRSGAAEWFMDYWNSDGTTAEMCGNGVRVFARYLTSTGLVPADSVSGSTSGSAAADVLDVPVLTRSGVVTASVGADLITVDMVQPQVGAPAAAELAGVAYPGISATCGNPNLVCAVDDLTTLDLSRPPHLDPAMFPAYANVEFVRPGEAVAGADAHVHMRVYERGAGETLSCGSGACAVAAVVLSRTGATGGVVAVDVPGGRLTITIDGNRCLLTGPAVIVAQGTVDLAALTGTADRDEPLRTPVTVR